MAGRLRFFQRAVGPEVGGLIFSPEAWRQRAKKVPIYAKYRTIQYNLNNFETLQDHAVAHTKFNSLII